MIQKIKDIIGVSSKLENSNFTTNEELESLVDYIEYTQSSFDVAKFLIENKECWLEKIPIILENQKLENKNKELLKHVLDYSIQIISYSVIGEDKKLLELELAKLIEECDNQIDLKLVIDFLEYLKQNSNLPKNSFNILNSYLDIAIKVLLNVFME